MTEIMTTAQTVIAQTVNPYFPSLTCFGKVVDLAEGMGGVYASEDDEMETAGLVTFADGSALRVRTGWGGDSAWVVDTDAPDEVPAEEIEEGVQAILSAIHCGDLVDAREAAAEKVVVDTSEDLTARVDIVCPEGKARTIFYVRHTAGRFRFVAMPTGENRELAGGHQVARRLGLPAFGDVSELPNLDSLDGATKTMGSADVRKLDTIDLADALRDGRIAPGTPAEWMARCHLDEAQINLDDVAPAGDPNDCPF